MALRLIEMVLEEKDGADVRELLKEHRVLDHRQIRLPDGEGLVRIVVGAEESEKDRAGKATRIAIGLWAALLATLVGMNLLLRRG